LGPIELNRLVLALACVVILLLAVLAIAWTLFLRILPLE
jgi:hypothetical protein